MIQQLIHFTVPWEQEYQRILNEYKQTCYPEVDSFIETKATNLLFCRETNIEFDDEENSTLVKLPNKNYILSYQSDSCL